MVLFILGPFGEGLMDRRPIDNELDLRIKELAKELRDAKRDEEMFEEAENIRQLFKFAPFGVFLIDVSGEIVACNENGAEQLGKTIETAIGTVLIDHFPAKASEKRQLKGMEAIQSRQAVTFEDRVEGRWYRNSIIPIFDEDGKPVQLAIYRADVTEYKTALVALEKSGEEYRRLFELLPQVVFEIDERGNLTFANRMAFDLFGYTRTDFEKGLNALQMLIPEDRERAAANIQKALRGERSSGNEYTSLTKDGLKYPVMLYSKPVMSKGEPVGLTGIMVDLTEVKRAEQALRENEEKYRTILESMEEGYYEVDISGNLTFFNDSVCKILGRTRNELMGMNNRELATPEVAKEVYQKFNRVYRTGIPINITEYEVIRKDGDVRVLEASVSLTRDSSDKPIGFRGVLRDVTDRKRAAEALKQSEEKFRGLAENNFDMVFSTDTGGSITYVSPAAKRIFGFKPEEMVGKHFMEYLAPSEINRVTQLFSAKLQGMDIETIGMEVIRKNGTHGHIELNASLVSKNGEVVGTQGVIRDVTEKMRLETQLKRAQKIQTFGLMAGGVAHDLNNILSGIVSYPDLILMDLPEDSPFRKPLETMKESGQRAAAVVSDLLTVARGVASRKEILNLNVIIDEFLASVEYTDLKKTNPTVAFKTDLDSDLLNVTASSTHIKKSLMNLVANASESIEVTGTVTISTRNRYLDEPLKGYEDIRQGEYVVLAVADDGFGIPQEDLEKIFEPFYTKKKMGRSGTGLGLVVVWNTIQDHDGYLDVRSSEKGTMFELFFPATRKQAAAEKEESLLEDYRGNGEKILIIDDEASQREIACWLLGRLGYKAEAVSSGEEAITYLKEHPVDLVVLDMIMPKGMNGRETYEKMIEAYPNQKAIIASGFSLTKDVRLAQSLGAGAYVQKPYTLEKIGAAVKEELKK